MKKKIKKIYANRHRLTKQIEMKCELVQLVVRHFGDSNTMYSPLKCLSLNIIFTHEFHNLFLGFTTVSVCAMKTRKWLKFSKMKRKFFKTAYRKELPRDKTRAFRRGVDCTVVHRKKPWFSTHFFQKFLHSFRVSKKNSTVSL